MIQLDCTSISILIKVTDTQRGEPSVEHLFGLVKIIDLNTRDELGRCRKKS